MVLEKAGVVDGKGRGGGQEAGSFCSGTTGPQLLCRMCLFALFQRLSPASLRAETENAGRTCWLGGQLRKVASGTRPVNIAIMTGNSAAVTAGLDYAYPRTGRIFVLCGGPAGQLARYQPEATNSRQRLRSGEFSCALEEVALL